MKKTLSVLLFFTLIFNSFSIAISPNITEVEVNGDKNYREIRVRNDSTTHKRYDVSINRPAALEDDSYYMGDKIQVYPPILSLKPGEVRVIKILVDTTETKDFSLGESRALLSIRERLSKNNVGVSIGTTINSTIYAYRGDTHSGFEIKDFSRERGSVRGRIINTGNASLKLKIRYSFEGSFPEEFSLFIPRDGSWDMDSSFESHILRVEILDRDSGRLIRKL